ncbi:hypothetical protein F7734_48950 [Scytonema sp. UIC 10036]|uniref:hypothetical protein n=1 Tax=Scytonema sp. UIC 10036 TaxID=2304196 RepID=UPI0012DA9D5A|nr:hypothetical protein [Scytonema sp. UIC 10036]MUG99787.1 hypothetical protein [Scytonema sp. UIC 10036]
MLKKPDKSQEMMITCVEITEKTLPLPIKINQDSLENYLKGKHFWFCLRKMFMNFFSGNPIFYNVNGQETEISKTLLELSFNHYLSLYKVINYGWDEISKSLQYLDTKITTPGDAIVYILKGDSLIWLEDNPVKPETLYRAWLEYTNCQGKSSNAKLNDYIRRIGKQTGVSLGNYQPSEHIMFRDTCVELANVSRSTIAKLAVKDFKRDQAELLAFLGQKLRGLW